MKFYMHTNIYHLKIISRKSDSVQGTSTYEIRRLQKHNKALRLQKAVLMEKILMQNNHFATNLF